MEADSEASLQSTFTTAAGMLGLPGLTMASFIVPSMIQWLQSNDEWLLVFDNADDFPWETIPTIVACNTCVFPEPVRGPSC